MTSTKTSLLSVCLILFVTLVSVRTCQACNSLIIPEADSIAFGRNLDGPFINGFWVVNQRDICKSSYIPSDVTRDSLVWQSLYGSVTINCYHIDIPLGGMNEAGLVVEHLATDSACFNYGGTIPGITPQQWIQYQLDNFATVDEVIAGLDDYSLIPWIFGIVHYIMCDATGDVAIIEYMNNGSGGCERRVYTDGDIPLYMTAISNTTYYRHTNFMSQFINFGGVLPVPTDPATLSSSTLYRFAYSCEMIRQYTLDPSPGILDYTFDVLTQFIFGNTPISIVYRPCEDRLHFFTSLNPDRRIIDFDGIDFSRDATRIALLWNVESDPDSGYWVANMDSVNAYMVDYFSTIGGPMGTAFAPYAPEMLAYRAEIPLPSVYLGADTTITTEDSLVLYAGSGYVTYYWVNTSTAETLFIDGTIHAPGIYEIWVEVTNSVGCMIADTITINLIDPVNVHEIAKPEHYDISIHPNPFNSAVTISLSVIPATSSVIPGSTRNPEIEIFDINGRMVAEIPANGSESAKPLSTNASGACRWQPDESLGSGVYLVRAKIGDESVTKRIVYLK